MAFKVVTTLHGGPPAQLEFPEGSSEVFVEGDVVTLGNDGYLREGKATDALIAGIAAAPASATTNNGDVDCPVYVGNQTIFEAPGNAVLAEAQRGATCDMIESATGDHEADNDTPSTNIFRIIKLIGTITALGHVHVLIIQGLDTIHTEENSPAA